MSDRKLWAHAPNFDWEPPLEPEMGAWRPNRELVCQVCGVGIAEHEARWPRRPHWAATLFAGMGRFPDEFAQYPAQIQLAIGFGPGVWVVPSRRARKKNVTRVGWRRVI